MCATCYWYILNRCISLTSKARESNFYTTPGRVVVRESFLSLPRIVEGKATGEKAEARRRCRLAKAGLRPDERLKALTPAISCARGIVVPRACGGRLVDFQAIDHCSDPGNRGHG
jgi:hypothetical protein